MEHKYEWGKEVMLRDRFEEGDECRSEQLRSWSDDSLRECGTIRDQLRDGTEALQLFVLFQLACFFKQVIHSLSHLIADEYACFEKEHCCCQSAFPACPFRSPYSYPYE